MTTTPSFLALLRSRKSLLFGVAGFSGGAAGSLIAECVPSFGKTVVPLVIFTACWSGIFAAILTLGLFWSQQYYDRRGQVGSKFVARALRTGLFAGALSGGVAQIVFSIGQDESFFSQVIVRSLCWGLMGALLGWRLSASVPNLGAKRGVLGGALGGFIGGLGFLFSTILLPEVFGRMFGIGLLGLALGLGIVAAERLWREASLEIIWAPREVTRMALGTIPLRIGGGDDHVFIHGLPPHAGSLALDNGKVHYTDSGNGQRTEFRDGSRIKIGTVELVIHAHA